MTPEVNLVLNRLRELGATVILDSEKDPPQSCPFSWKMGLDYGNKTLFFTGECDDESVGHLIHEAGHLLACSKTPEDSEEYDFLGWELALAMELDLLGDWLHGQQDYTVTTNDNGSIEIGLLSDDELSELIEERVDYARSIGLIRGGSVVAIR